MQQQQQTTKFNDEHDSYSQHTLFEFWHFFTHHKHCWHDWFIAKIYFNVISWHQHNIKNHSKHQCSKKSREFDNFIESCCISWRLSCVNQGIGYTIDHWLLQTSQKCLCQTEFDAQITDSFILRRRWHLKQT